MALPPQESEARSSAVDGDSWSDVRELAALLSSLGQDRDIDKLRATCAEFAERRPEYRVAAAQWLVQRVQMGKLDASVWSAIRDLFEPRTSQLPEGAQTAPTLARADDRPDPQASRTLVRGRAPAHSPSHGPVFDATEEVRVGSVLKNRFVLVEELGRGGMGCVFKARDRVPEAYDDRHLFLALKVISQEASQHPDAFKALQREARRARGLTHENVVKVYDFDQDGACVFMTMEYLDGRTLHSYMQSEYRQGLLLAKAWPILRAIGAALEHGHEKRIVHSDLKPGNVFISRDGTVKVLDFGISRPLRALDENAEETLFDPGKRLGGLTPAYAALEMWNYDEPDPRDDVYAFACLTYELITGRHPFGRCSAKQAFEAGMQPARIPGLHRRQWEALERGLALKRQDRTPTVRAFVDAMAPASERKQRKPYTILAAVAAVSVLVLGIAFYSIRQAANAPVDVLQCAAPLVPEPPIEAASSA